MRNTCALTPIAVLMSLDPCSCALLSRTKKTARLSAPSAFGCRMIRLNFPTGVSALSTLISLPISKLTSWVIGLSLASSMMLW